MSALRGLITGFGMAAIKDKEAKDNARMEVVKAAGLDYYTNQLPQHKKTEENRAQAYTQLSKILGSEEAADYFDANGFITGDGKDVERIQKMLEDKQIKPDAFKNYIPTSNYSDRYNTRQSDFETRFDLVNKNFNIQGSGIGPSTIKGLLSQEEGDITKTIKGEPGSQVGPVVTEGTPDRVETVDRTTSSLPISAFYGAKPETQGIEAKYNNIKKAVNETMNYGSPIYNAADGSTTFNISDQFQSKSQAHIQIASAMTKDDDSINQLDAVARSKQELDNQTVIPFKIIAMSLGDNTEYREGHGKANAILSGVQSRTIDAANITIKRQVKNPETNKIETKDTGVSIFQYLTDVYNNDLLKDRQSGKVNSLVFKKFLENIPPTIMYEGQSLKSVIAQAHESSFFKL